MSLHSSFNFSKIFSLRPLLALQKWHRTQKLRFLWHSPVKATSRQFVQIWPYASTKSAITDQKLKLRPVRRARYYEKWGHPNIVKLYTVRLQISCKLRIEIEHMDKNHSETCYELYKGGIWRVPKCMDIARYMHYRTHFWGWFLLFYSYHTELYKFNQLYHQ